MLPSLGRVSKFIRGGVPRIDWDNPITAGLTGVWLFGMGTWLGGAGVGLTNLVTGRPAPIRYLGVNDYLDGFPDSPAYSRIGAGVNSFYTDYSWRIGTSADLYGDSISIGCIRRFINTTPPYNGNGSGAPGDAASMGLWFPYADSNIYWDCPNNPDGRVAFNYTMTTNLENWVFTSGPGSPGKTVWLNGIQQFSGSAPTTDTGAPFGDFWIGYHPQSQIGQAGNQEWYLFATWRRKLTDPEAQLFTLDPLVFLIWPEDEIFRSQVGIPGYAYLRPDADVSDGLWSNELGNSTNLYASVGTAPVNDADYIVSSVNPVADTVRVSLSDPPSGVGGPPTVRYRFRGTGAVDLTVRLLQGGTTIATWTHPGISGDYVVAEQLLTAPQYAAITDFSDLSLEFQADS